MAKKPKEEKVVEEKPSIYLDASFILDRNTGIVSAGPAVDSILCGGVPEATVMLITGPEKLGKTTLGLTIIRNAQKMGKVGIIADVEHRVRKKNLDGVEGLDQSSDKLKFIRSKEGDILSGEEFLTRCEQTLHDFPGCVLLIDSLSALCSNTEQTSGYGDKQMGGTGALQAKFCRRIPSIVAINGGIVIGIAHIASNIGMPGTTENVGRKVQYQHDIKIKCKKPFKTKTDPTEFEWNSGDNRIGHRLLWECPTNALGNSGGTSVGYLRYGHGLDDTAEILDLSVELGLVEKGGSWFTIEGEKIQGWDSAYMYLRETPDVFEKLKKSIEGML